MRKFSFLLFFIVFAFVFTACSDNDNDPIIVSKSRCLPRVLITVSQSVDDIIEKDSTEFIYNETKLMKVINFVNSKLNSIIDLKYNTDGLLIELNIYKYMSDENFERELQSSYNFIYHSDSLVCAMSGVGEVDSVFLQNKKINKIVFDTSGTTLFSKNYTYDKSFNIISINTKIFGYTYTEVLEYDNYNGIFKNIDVPQWAYLFLLDSDYAKYINNNVKRNSIETSSYSHKLKYNESGYPLEILVKKEASGQNVSQQNIEYIEVK